MTYPSRPSLTAVSTALVALIVGCAETPAPARESADPEAAFRARFGREWALVRLGALEIPLPPAGTPADTPGRDLVPGRRPTIRFTMEPPGAGGRSFCNGYGGPFALRGDSLRITEIVSSAVGCDGPDSLETRFFRGLRETRQFRLDSTRLVLIGEDGPRLEFEAVDGASARSTEDSARAAYGAEVAALLLDTRVHELRGDLGIKVINTDPNDPEAPLADFPVPHPANPGPHTYLGVMHAELGALRAALGDSVGSTTRALPAIRVEGERVYVGRPPREMLILGHHHGEQLHVPVKLFARPYGAYVRVACPLANCATIWPREILSYMRRAGHTGSAGVLDGFVEGLLDSVDVRRRPGG